MEHLRVPAHSKLGGKTKMNIKDALTAIEEYVESAESKLEIVGVKPKYTLGQKVWILKGNQHSWHNFPISSEDARLEDMFEQEEVEKIIICKLHDSGTRGCGTFNKNPVVAVYEFNRYMYDDSILREEDIYQSLPEAIQLNKDKFEKELAVFKKRIEDEKREKKRRLQEELKQL